MVKRLGPIREPGVRFSLRITGGENESLEAMAAARGGISRQRMIRYLIRQANNSFLQPRPKAK